MCLHVLNLKLRLFSACADRCSRVTHMDSDLRTRRESPFREPVRLASFQNAHIFRQNFINFSRFHTQKSKIFFARACRRSRGTYILAAPGRAEKSPFHEPVRLARFRNTNVFEQIFIDFTCFKPNMSNLRRSRVTDVFLGPRTRRKSPFVSAYAQNAHILE